MQPAFPAPSVSGPAPMRIATTRLSITTDEGVSIEDVTHSVNAFVQSTAIEEGICVLTIGAGPFFLSLAPDLDEAFDDLLRLARGNLYRPLREAAAREASLQDRSDTDPILLAPPGVLADCVSLPVRQGAVQLGNWDAIVFIDGGGPAVRAIDVTLMGASAP